MDARTKKKSLLRENKINQSKSLDCCIFKGLMRFRQDILFFSLIEKMSKRGSVCRVTYKETVIICPQLKALSFSFTLLVFSF